MVVTLFSLGPSVIVVCGGPSCHFERTSRAFPSFPPSHRPCLPASFRHYGHRPTRSAVSALGCPFLAVRCSPYSEVDGSKGNEVLVLQSTNVRTDSGPRPPNHVESWPGHLGASNALLPALGREDAIERRELRSWDILIYMPLVSSSSINSGTFLEIMYARGTPTRFPSVLYLPFLVSLLHGV